MWQQSPDVAVSFIFIFLCLLYLFLLRIPLPPPLLFPLRPFLLPRHTCYLLDSSLYGDDSGKIPVKCHVVELKSVLLMPGMTEAFNSSTVHVDHNRLVLLIPRL